MRTPALALLLTLVPAAAAARGGVLPVLGEAAALEAALGRASGSGRAVLAPSEVRARLSTDAEIAEGLRAAREATAAAEHAQLRMNRSAAIRSARSAVDRLEGARARFHAPELLTRAYALLALTQLLRPADPDAAGRALREALLVDPGFRPTPTVLPPRAARLLEEQRQQVAGPRPPTAADLAWLATRARVQQLVWLGLLPTSAARLRLQLIAHDATSGRGQTRSVECARLELPERAAALVRAALEEPRVHARPLASSRPLPPPLTAAPPPPAAPRPWHRRWWPWTIAAVVVASGLAVGLGVGLSSKSSGGEPSSLTIKAHLPP